MVILKVAAAVQFHLIIKVAFKIMQGMLSEMLNKMGLFLDEKNWFGYRPYQKRATYFRAVVLLLLFLLME